VQLSPTASTADIRAAIADVLENDEYRLQAARLAEVLAGEHGPLDVVLEMEQLVDPSVLDAP
jgi:hypothetical protein